jgi:glycerophosphoryl diester phosphodiesterase
MKNLTDPFLNLLNHCLNWIPQPLPTVDQLIQTQLVAHRGAWLETSHLENTMPAFESCLNANIWAIEFDLRWTKDDEPVIHHDPSLLRVFAQDIMIHKESWNSLHGQQLQIPHLKEINERLGGKIHFFIELKTPPTTNQAQQLNQILNELNPTVDFHFMSFHIDDFKPLIPHFPPSSFVLIGRTNIKDLFLKSKTHQISGLTGHYLMFNQQLRQACRQQGIKVGTGFPDGNNLFYRELNQGVDWIFTNRPLLLSQTQKTLTAQSTTEPH